MRKIIFWLSIFVFIFILSAYRQSTVQNGPIDENSILPLVNGARSAMHILSPIDHYEMYGEDGNPVGYVISTTKIPPQVDGYAGEIECLVGMDLNGKITGLEILAHSENPNYMALVFESGLLKKFIGLDSEQAERLDAVTSATLSSKALIDDISSAAEEVSEQIIRKKSGAASTADRKIIRWKFLLILIPIFSSVTAIFLPNIKYLRASALALSVLITGFYLNTPITIGNILDLPSGSFRPSANIGLTILMAAAFLFAIMRGGFYCQYMCPFGALQEGACRLIRWKVEVDDKMLWRVTYIRYAVSAIAVISIFLIGLDSFRAIEPFALCFSFHPPAMALIQAAAILISSIFFGRIWCRCFCPTGLFMEALDDVGVLLRKQILKRRRIATEQ